VNHFQPLPADAILPSLMLIWPITILLLLPIVGIEARYARSRLNLSTGEAFRVFGIANVASTIVGLPVATAVAGAFQNRMQIRLFGTRQWNLDQWSRNGDASQFARALGQYPRWTLIAAAILMFGMCFMISWWIEATYVKWWMRRRQPDAEVTPMTSHIVRNANLLSYVLLAAISIGVLALL
jgi:cation transporter-like permease